MKRTFSDDTEAFSNFSRLFNATFRTGVYFSNASGGRQESTMYRYGTARFTSIKQNHGNSDRPADVSYQIIGLIVM